MPSRVVVVGPASAAWSPSNSASSTWSMGRGPGLGSIAKRSHATPPRATSGPRDSQNRPTASAPTTSPPPPIPRTSTRRAAWMRWIRSGGAGRSGGDGLGLAADVADLGRGAVEFLVRHHRSSLEGELAIDLDPRAAAVVLVADSHGDRARDPVDPQEQDVDRMAPLPPQALV